jgi:hypothetical protein
MNDTVTSNAPSSRAFVFVGPLFLRINNEIHLINKRRFGRFLRDTVASLAAILPGQAVPTFLCYRQFQPQAPLFFDPMLQPEPSTTVH